MYDQRQYYSKHTSLIKSSYGAKRQDDEALISPRQATVRNLIGLNRNEFGLEAGGKQKVNQQSTAVSGFPWTASSCARYFSPRQPLERVDPDICDDDCKVWVSSVATMCLHYHLYGEASQPCRTPHDSPMKPSPTCSTLLQIQVNRLNASPSPLPLFPSPSPSS